MVAVFVYDIIFIHTLRRKRERQKREKNTHDIRQLLFLQHISGLICYLNLCNDCRPRGGRLLVSCVPMCEQKNDEKGYFFRAGQCAALSPFKVGKSYFCRKRVCVLQMLQKVAE